MPVHHEQEELTRTELMDSSIRQAPSSKDELPAILEYAPAIAGSILAASHFVFPHLMFSPLRVEDFRPASHKLRNPEGSAWGHEAITPDELEVAKEDKDSLLRLSDRDVVEQYRKATGSWFGPSFLPVPTAVEDGIRPLVEQIFTTPVEDRFVKALALYGSIPLGLIAKRGIKATLVAPGDSFTKYSPKLAEDLANNGITENMIAGIFSRFEEHLWFAERPRMDLASTVVHEMAHALDYSLGAPVPKAMLESGRTKGIRRNYVSFESAVLQKALSLARMRGRAINNYALSGLDEYFAESLRTYIGSRGEVGTAFYATPAMLREKDPFAYEIMESFVRSGYKRSALVRA